MTAPVAVPPAGSVENIGGDEDPPGWVAEPKKGRGRGRGRISQMLCVVPKAKTQHKANPKVLKTSGPKKA